MYQVLARKWRPKNFHELVGQEHVSQALIYALNQQRLHHAYLFTGTRGVGKTTIARIFSKSINCLTNGISANPCGICEHCREIDEGCFPDLMEIDAASRTGVDDTREILDNVPYAPVKGKFKVYLIDEVHMFSRSSFNALLKTLEEPPPHVKFVLATTDVQKLPITVLSRCLQFQLKNMNQAQIVQHLSHVLRNENIEFDEESLDLLADGANGSMRDALSLLDQAIIFGQGKLKSTTTAQLLGTIPTLQLLQLLQAVSLYNAKKMREIFAKMGNFSPDYSLLAQKLLQQIQMISVVQLDALRPNETVSPIVVNLAAKVPAELVQLWYQIMSETWKNLPHHPDARLCLEMGLLRMIAFRPIFSDTDLYNASPIREVETEIPQAIENIDVNYDKPHPWEEASAETNTLPLTQQQLTEKFQTHPKIKEAIYGLNATVENVRLC